MKRVVVRKIEDIHNHDYKPKTLHVVFYPSKHENDLYFYQCDCGEIDTMRSAIGAKSRLRDGADGHGNESWAIFDGHRNIAENPTGSTW